MKINCTKTNITEDQAVEIAAMEHPDIITRVFWMIFPKMKKTIHVTEVRLIYCMYYLITGIIIAQKRTVYYQDFSASMSSIVHLARTFIGAPNELEKDVFPTQVIKPVFSAGDAKEKILDFLTKRGYKKFRVVPTIEIKSEKSVYRPFYCCVCEKNDKKSVRIIDAHIAERDYLLELKYKNFNYME